MKKIHQSDIYASLFFLAMTLQKETSKTELFRRLNSPQVGDLVFETSTLHKSIGLYNQDKKEESLDFFPKVIGRILSIEPGKGDYGTTLYQIEALDGKIYTWENCRFIVLPTKEL